jgi:hypothetical protein
MLEAYKLCFWVSTKIFWIPRKIARDIADREIWMAGRSNGDAVHEIGITEGEGGPRDDGEGPGEDRDGGSGGIAGLTRPFGEAEACQFAPDEVEVPNFDQGVDSRRAGQASARAVEDEV